MYWNYVYFKDANIPHICAETAKAKPLHNLAFFYSFLIRSSCIIYSFIAYH
jgi:hypothetical protein